MMKLDKKKEEAFFLITSALLGTGIGFAIGFGVKASPVVVAAVAAAGGLPAALITYQVSDSRNSRKHLQEVKKLNQAHRKELKEAKAKLVKSSNQLERIFYANTCLEKENRVIPRLRKEIADLSADLEARIEAIKVLEEANETWEEGFDDLLEKQSNSKAQLLAQQRVREELVSVFDHHNGFTKKAMSIASQMGKLVEEAEGKNDALILKDKDAMLHFMDSLEDSGKTMAEAKAAFAEEKNILNAKILHLERQNKGELLEPEYGQHGYDIPAQIATDICRILWNKHQVPLRLEGVETSRSGLSTAGYGYGGNQDSTQLVSFIKDKSKALCEQLGIHKITKVEKLAIAPVIAVSFLRESVLKESEIKLLIGSGEEFLNYVVNHPIRYRLIADPGEGKTPTTAVMLSAILKSGCKTGNVPNGRKVPHTLVDVSYPDRYSSIKDEEYPLDRFLKYATTREAVNSFNQAIEEWEYRKTHLDYAKKVFQILFWDEFDNTISSASSPKDVANSLKILLKEGGHSNIGWILSGQSVMTRQIPGFTNDDRSLFTEIVIGIPKIRKYLQNYGRKLGDKVNKKLLENLDSIDDYVTSRNSNIVDSARLLRVSLVVDSKSPKLFFLPNFDLANFDEEAIRNSENVAKQIRNGSYQSRSQTNGGAKAKSQSGQLVNLSQDLPPQMTIEVQPQTPISKKIPCCPKCNSTNLGKKSAKRYLCKDCRKTTGEHLVNWKKV